MIRIFLLLVIVAAGSCKKDPAAPQEPADTETPGIYPVPPSRWMQTGGMQYFSSGFVGDPMPYYENGRYHIFYLHDARDGKPGFHPVHKFTSYDFAAFAYDGLMVNYAGTSDQDLAIGTGSVVRAGNTYYCYYTGHNYLFPNSGLPKEGLMYATSTDLKTWTKKQGFNLIAPPGYDRNDFRDPHVFFNPEAREYWMLVSARKDHKAVIALFTSADPASDTWILKDPLYTTDNDAYFMLECADIFQWGEHWYLTFSENNAERTTHYRMAPSSSGPWIKPAQDLLEGEFFYAGKTASNGPERYLFGWVATKEGNTDYGNKQWAGNLVTQQLIRKNDGTLQVKIPEAVKEVFNKEISLVQKQNSGVTRSGEQYTVNSGGLASFEPFSGQRKVTATLKGLTENAEAGFLWGYNRANSNDYYKLRIKNNRAFVVKVQGRDEYIDAEVPLEKTGNEISITLVIDGSVVVTEINRTCTLTGRSYWLPNAEWGIYATGAQVTFENLKLWSMNKL